MLPHVEASAHAYTTRVVLRIVSRGSSLLPGFGRHVASHGRPDSSASSGQHSGPQPTEASRGLVGGGRTDLEFDSFTGRDA